MCNRRVSIRLFKVCARRRLSGGRGAAGNSGVFRRPWWECRADVGGGIYSKIEIVFYGFARFTALTVFYDCGRRGCGYKTRMGTFKHRDARRM